LEERDDNEEEAVEVVEEGAGYEERMYSSIPALLYAAA
jgi:hypothetical protein